MRTVVCGANMGVNLESDLQRAVFHAYRGQHNGRRLLVRSGEPEWILGIPDCWVHGNIHCSSNDDQDLECSGYGRDDDCAMHETPRTENGRNKLVYIQCPPHPSVCLHPGRGVVV